MLQLQHLSLTHRHTLSPLIQDLSCIINPGKKIALIGEEGNGKSTLLKAIYNPTSIDSYAILEGTITNHFTKTVYLPQQLPDTLAQLSIEAYVFQQAWSAEMDYDRLYRLSAQLHFDSGRFSSEQTLATLSGGEKIKLQLLILLAQSPDLILLDEPSNDLDSETVHWLARWIQDAPQTIVFISHDEWLLEQAATGVILLESAHHKKVLHHTVASVDYRTFQEERDHHFQKQTQIARKQQAQHHQKIEQLTRATQHSHHLLNTVSRQTPYEAARMKKRMKTLKSMAKRIDREASFLTEIPVREDAILVKLRCPAPLPSKKVVLHLEDDSLKVGQRTLATKLNLWIHGQDHVAITGQNGIGKSTLLRRLYQQLQGRPDLTVAYMPQHYQELLDGTQTPIEALTQSGDSEERTRIITYLASIRFSQEEMTQPISCLSGGQRAKLCLLKLDLAGANVLLLDEPTRNFSPVSQPEVREIFREFPGCIIAVSHDTYFIEEVCGRVIELTSNGFEDKAEREGLF